MFIPGLIIGSAGLLLGVGGALTRYRNKTKWVALVLMMAGGACLILGQ